MNNILLTLGFFCALNSCKTRNKIIDRDDLKSIIIEINYRDSSIASKREISNPDTLTRIVDYFNDSEKTPIKFLPTCKFILLHLNGKEEVVFVSGQSLKYNGVTYKSSKNIEQIIGR